MKHILFIFCDQFRYDCIGENGNPYIQTPYLDALARESVKFDRCYTPAPVCVPARLSMLSGQYAARTGNSNNNPKLKYAGEGFYSALTRSGFNSCCIGKMHHVWDKYGSLGFGKRYTQEELSHPDDDYTKFIAEGPYKNVFDYNGQRTEMYYVPQVAQLPAEAHPTQWIGDRSVEFIRSCDPENENVFLMSSFIHPHPPFCPPAPWNKLYRGYDVIEPFVPDGYDYEKYRPLMHLTFGVKRLDLSRLDLLRLRDFYYACVSFVDYQVGRIIAALKEKGMYDDTVIIFSTDHGEMLGDYENMGKRTMLSPASRVPFMWRIPGHAPQTRHDVASLVDIAPTLLSMFGVPYDKAEYDGVDLFSDERHDMVFSQYNSGQNGVYMAATSDDKLVFSPAADRYFYFKGIPEIADEYDPANARCAYLKDRLDAYMASDRGVVPADPNAPPKPKKKKPEQAFGVARLDHANRHDEELARIPAPYKLDLVVNHKED